MKHKTRKAVTLQAVADEAKVSLATVSRFVNGHSLRPTMYQRIKDVLDRRGYELAGGPKVVKQASTGTIGMIIPEVKHNFFSKIAAGSIEEARKNGQLLLIASSNGDQHTEKAVIELFSTRRIDGLIYIPVTGGEAIPSRDIFENVPLVVAARRDVYPRVPHVYTDNVRGGYLATRYLHNLGRRRIGFVAGFWETPFSVQEVAKLVYEKKSGAFSSFDRLRGYMWALEEAGLPYDPSLLSLCKYSYEGGTIAASELLLKNPDMDAIIATSDPIAFGILTTLKSHGIHVPERISVISWDNSELSQFADPQLTSVHQPSEQIGTNAMKLLNRLIEDDGSVEDVILNVSIVPRDSTCLKRN